MPEKIRERCRRICGDHEDNCFRHDRTRLFCISDMIINKAFGIEAVLDAIRQTPHGPEIDEMLALTAKDLGELLSWAKFLQGDKECNNELLNS
ncbi:MAG: hypothetical protein C0402_03565 [Thermodesulfovibrio sp.]|nr:hypothetical protein [Thermodesulfovibrio sp.]